MEHCTKYRHAGFTHEHCRHFWKVDKKYSVCFGVLTFLILKRLYFRIARKTTWPRMPRIIAVVRHWHPKKHWFRRMQFNYLSHLMAQKCQKMQICFYFSPPIGSWVMRLKSWFRDFQTYFNDKYLEYLLWNCPQMNAIKHHWWLVNIGPGNGLVSSGNKSLP